MNLRLLAVLWGLCLATLPVHARAQDCGTIVVPPGLGIGPGADVTAFNPLFITSEYNAEATGLIFQPLFWINRYHEVDWTRSIASAVTTPDAGKTYDVTLRAWQWSDGKPVTSADVLYAWKLIQAYGTDYVGYGAGGIPMMVQSVTAPDATHVRVVLTRAVNPEWFILNGLGQLMPLPQHAWARFTTDEIWQGQSDPAFFAVTDGPLVLTALNVGIDAEFAPNPHYGGAKMHFSRFIMKFQNAEAQELEEMQAGDLDMSNIPFDLYDKASHMPGTSVVRMLPTYSWHELIPNALNRQSGFFADVKLRQALADAIDQHKIIQLAMHGLGVEVHGPVPPYPPNFLSPAQAAGHYPTGYNPAQARALLAQDGWAAGTDGILQKNGQRLSFTLNIPAGQPMRVEIAESIQQDLQAVGIEMKVQQIEFNTLIAQMVGQPQAWQAILVATSVSGYPSGEDIFKTGGYMNNIGYSDAKMDQLIDASTNTPGLSGLFAYEDYAAAQQPVIFLPNEVYPVLVRKGLHGINDFINPLGAWAPEKLTCDAP